MHEHIVVQSPGVRQNWPWVFDRSLAVELGVRGLQEAKAAGVDTVVDLTTVDLGRDIPLVAEIASQVDVHVIVCTGLWRSLPRYIQNRSPDAAADLFVTDIVDGIQGTSYKAALIKVASEDEAAGPMDVALRAAARAHRRTGVPISTHTDTARRSGLEQQRVFADEGVDLQRVVIGHSGDTEDLDYLERLLEKGSYIGMDRFGVPAGALASHMSIERRVQVIAELCRRGYASRIVLSHDTSCYHDTRHPEAKVASTRYTYIPEQVIPALLEAGVSQAQLDQMACGNPRAIFERTGAY